MSRQTRLVYASYGAWAAERLALVPGATCDPRVLRADYVGWCSDQRMHWLPMSKQRAVIKSFGGRYKGTKVNTLVMDVRLLPMPYRVPYRVPGTQYVHDAGEELADPTEALVALYEAGLVTDTTALDIAWLRLAPKDAFSMLCRKCGVSTRRIAVGFHVACE